METSNYPEPDNKLSVVELNREFYLILKDEVEFAYSKKIITAADCLELSDAIYAKSFLRVDFNLLVQFFSPSHSGQNIPPAVVEVLCKYCGYNSAAQLIVSKRMGGDNRQVLEENFLLKYFIHLFSSKPKPYKQHETFYSFAEIVIKYLNEYVGEADQFHKGIVNSTHAMKYYFERFINIDQLETYYSDGLCLYIGAAQLPEQKAFGQSLLCVKYWLSNDCALLKYTFAEIEKLKFDKNDADVCGVYFSAALLHRKCVHGDTSKVFDEANNMHQRFKNKEMPINERFELIFCRVCLIAGRFEESLHYAQYLLECCSGEEKPEENDFYQTLLLLKVISLSEIGFKTEAGRLFEMIIPEQFNFLSRKSDMVLYRGLEAQFVGKYN